MLNVITILGIVCFILFISGLIIAGTAHKKFNNICNKYANVPNSLNMTGYEFLMISLNLLKQNTQVFYHNNINEGDCYIASKDAIVLNQKSFFGKSIVDIAICSHEMGHSIQKRHAKIMMFFINFLQFINSLLQGLFLPLLIIGLIVLIIPFEYNFVGKIFIIIGLISFLTSLLLKILLIPLEYDASKRAQKFLKINNLLNKEEYQIVKKIQKRALFTYIASLFEKPYIFLYKLFNRK